MRFPSYTARLLAGIAREIGLGVCLLYTCVSATTFVAPLALALGVRPLVDGAYQHDRPQVVLGAVLAGIAVLLTVLAPVGYRWATIRMRERSVMVVQRRLLALTSEAPRLTHFERPEFWDRVQVLKRGTEDLANGMTLALIGPVVLAQLVSTVILLGRLQPLLSLVPIIAFPAIWLSRRSERLKQSAETQAAQPRRLAQHLFTLSTGAQSAKDVRVYNLSDELLDRHRAAAEAVRAKTESALFKSVAANAASWLLFTAAYAGALILVLRQVARGSATAGDVALTVTLAAAVVAGAARLTDLSGSVTRIGAVAEHYRWLEDQTTLERRALPAPPPPRLTKGIELDAVGFGYGEDDRQVLSDVSVTLPAGAVVAVVGENGAGKTTLVKLLTGMYAPNRGRILIDGKDLADLDLAAYRRSITAGFQDHARFEFTAARAVGVGDATRLDDEQLVASALEAGDARFVADLPQGGDTQLGAQWAGGVDLSGGQWQKIAIARSMMRPSALLSVYDEPSAALDPQSEHALFKRIAANARIGKSDGRITLLISHRFSTVRMADLIIVLGDGRVLEQGSHNELMANAGLYAELFEMQAAAYR